MTTSAAGHQAECRVGRSEQWLERAAGRCAAAPLISRRRHWPEPTPAPDDTRARRPCACRRPQPRAHTGGRGRTSRDRPECGRANPSPTATSIRACAPYERTTGRRRPPPRHPAARHRRLAGGAHGRPNQQPAPVEPGATTSSPCSSTSPSLAATPRGHAERRAAGCAVVSNGVSNRPGIPDG